MQKTSDEPGIDPGMTPLYRKSKRRRAIYAFSNKQHEQTSDLRRLARITRARKSSREETSNLRRLDPMTGENPSLNSDKHNNQPKAEVHTLRD